MKIYRQIPAPEILDEFLKSRQGLPHSYPDVGATAGEFPIGYNHDHNRIYLGEGEEIFERGKAFIRQWEMFPPPWTQIYPSLAPIEAGSTVAVLFRLFGVWWLQSCRIVYTIDRPDCFGFAYGTLPGHVERGEERFSIVMEDDGKVWYRIDAFSLPAYWFIRLGYPLARRFQKRFVTDSLHVAQVLTCQSLRL
jgi:uncharacterized protein (UPF0548 family)